MFFYALVEREREKGKKREFLFVSRDWGLLRWTRQRIAEITKKEYDKMVKSLKRLSFRQVKGNEADIDKFCNNDTCEIDLEVIKETQEV